jgi:hypothetical protein
MIPGQPIRYAGWFAYYHELVLQTGNVCIQKGKHIFPYLIREKAWAVLNIFGGQEAMVKVGNAVRISPNSVLKGFQGYY